MTSVCVCSCVEINGDISAVLCRERGGQLSTDSGRLWQQQFNSRRRTEAGERATIHRQEQRQWRRRW